MSTPEDSPGGEARLDARASDSARIYQAARDQYVAERDLHLHYETGVRRARRALADGAPDAECPYPGLAAFVEEQSYWFFGRDAVTADLLVRLDERLREGGALAVVAPSGAGKSSLLRAGLLPALARGALPAPGSAHWPRLLLTPTAHPMAALSARLAQAVGVNPQSAGGGPQDYTVGVLAALGEGGGPPGGRLVLVVDQLEELFTLCGNEQERRDFLDVVTMLTSPYPGGGGSAALVVLGLRSDFYTQCADYPQLRSVLQDRQLMVGSMTPTELREAIVFPAQAVGLDLEPGLVEVVLRDLGGHTGDGRLLGAEPRQGYEAGRLPLLAHALRATWQQRHGHTLTVEAYQSTGGIRHAVTTTADRIFNDLDPDGQRIARTLFLRLVKIGDGVEDTRRRLPRADLLGTDPDRTGTDAVISAFTRGRLLTQHQDTVEITHEALLQAWSRLRDWIEADRSGHLVHQNLEEAATAWRDAGQDTGMLYRGGRLEAARAWANRPHNNQVSPAASAFLATSVQHSQRGARIRRAAIAILTALALIATVAAVIALQQRSGAQRQRDEAVFSRVKAEGGGLRDSQASLAAQLNLTALGMRPGDTDLRSRLIQDASQPLSQPLSGGKGPFNSVAFSPDGRLLAAGAKDGSLQLWRFSGSARPELISHTPSDSRGGPVYVVAMASGGRLLATANNDGSARLFDISDPAHPRPLGHTPTSSPERGPADVGVAISPDSKVLATARNETWADLWDISDPLRPRHLVRATPVAAIVAVGSVAFSPSGRYLAGADGDGTAQLWDVRHPKAPVRLGHINDLPHLEEGPIVSGTAVFSPDEMTLATGGSDGMVRLWDISRAKHPTLLGVPLPHEFSSSVTAVAFSPDGRTLATSSTNQSVRLWNLTDPTDVSLMSVLHGHLIGAWALAFRPHDNSLVTAGADPAPLLWHLRGNVLNRDQGLILSLTFGQHDRTMLTVSYDGAIRRWSIRDTSRPALLDSGWFEKVPDDADIDAWPDVLAVSPNGRTMALARDHGVGVELWDIANLHHAKKLGTLEAKSDSVYTTLAFSPNGRVLAAGNQLTPSLWDVSDPRHATLLHQFPKGTVGWVDQLAFSPDGRVLASLYAGEGQVTLWDVRDPGHPTRTERTKPLGGGEYGRTMAFSPKGHLLAVGSDRGKIRLWSVSPSGTPTPRGIAAISTGAISTLSFSPDERLLASGGEDNAIHLWDVSAPAHPTAFGIPLTGHTRAVETAVFAPTAPVLVSDGYDGTIRFWPTEASYDADLVCTASAGTLTPAQWKLHLSGLPYNPPCP